MSSRMSWCALVGIAMAAAACHKNPPSVAPSSSTAAQQAAEARRAAPPPPPAAAMAPATTLSDEELFRRKSLSELNAEHPLADAFFDYEENDIRSDARDALQRDAQWLARWPQTAILIEGYCDERGTAEYNLALGDRRAEAVKSYLTSLGISAERISVRSLGKEAPFCRDSVETCWQQNRRGHFVITGK